MSMAFPSSVTAAPCHLPPGEGFRRAVLAFPQGKGIYTLKYSHLIQHFVLKNALSYPCLSPHTLLDTEGHAG